VLEQCGPRALHNQHNIEVDARREAYLRARGYRIKRYWNHELNQSFDNVLDDIYREMIGTNP
jgi:adenine-specific DNA-methyltransferase